SYHYQADNGPGHVWTNDPFGVIYATLRCKLCKKEGRTILGKHLFSPNTCEASARYLELSCKYVKSGDIKVNLDYEDQSKIEIILKDSIPAPPEPLLQKAAKLQTID
ncbi:MAG: hypothetical protein JSW73_05420, partial [Candidatus Woesearchaeota archaeon]